jgi:hypothetical protein
MQLHWKDRAEDPNTCFDLLLSEGSHAFFRTDEREGYYLAWSALGEKERRALLKAKRDLEETIGRIAAELREALAARLGDPG